MTMKRIASWLAILVASLAAGAAGAQQYPSKPVKIIVGFAPGGGSEYAIKSPADGYTLLLTPASYTVNANVYKLSFDPLNDITPIVQLSRGPYVVAVHPSVQAKTLRELVALAKKDPDKLAYASSGNGS